MDTGDDGDAAPTPVDVSSAGRGVWLVKVPKYISEQWKARQGQKVGRLEVTPGNTVVFIPQHSSVPPSTSATEATSTGTVSRLAESESLANVQHEFITRDVPNQTLAVLSEDKSELYTEMATKSGRVSVDGRVVKRAEFRPPASSKYLNLKARQMQSADKPRRTIEQLARAEVKYKPVDAHKEDQLRMKAKKEGSKAVRLDKGIVIDMIFKAFEKHQYYRLADLQAITQQPPSYVKELLSEYAVYNSAPPHKAMWELKPEYTAYAQDKKDAGDQ